MESLKTWTPGALFVDVPVVRRSTGKPVPMPKVRRRGKPTLTRPRASRITLAREPLTRMKHGLTYRILSAHGQVLRAVYVGRLTEGENKRGAVYLLLRMANGRR